MDHPRQNRLGRWIVLATAAIVLAVGMRLPTAQAQEAEDSASDTVMGTTVPSQKLELSFEGAGIIGKVSVKEGQRVKAGQELMSEDDRMEQKLYEAMSLEADSDLPIQFAQKTLDDSNTKLKRLQSAGSAAAGYEILEAQLDVALSQIKLQQAQQDQKQKKLQAERQKIKVELMHLKSPVDGIVQKLSLGLGEVVDPSNPNKPACTIVRNDPLWVEIHIPSNQAAQLALGDSLPVHEDGKKNWTDGKVIYMDPVADAASGTRLVRLEVPNPHAIPSGLQVWVKLPAKVLSAGVAKE